MPRALLLAYEVTIVAWIVVLGMSHLSADRQQQLLSRQQTVQEEWNRGYRLCRCTVCCAEGPSYQRTTFVPRARPPTHSLVHGLAGQGNFCHFSREQLYAEHLAALSDLQQGQDHGSPGDDTSPVRGDHHSAGRHDQPGTPVSEQRNTFEQRGATPEHSDAGAGKLSGRAGQPFLKRVCSSHHSATHGTREF